MAPRAGVALGAVAAAGLALASGQPLSPGYFTINAADQQQVILGIGFEVQSDSIGSGNNGMPNATTSVPWDLVPSERARWYSDMLQGFRYCRFAMGLYFRGLANGGKNIVERWPGQAAVIAEMLRESGTEGVAAEYWSPPPAWKNTNALTDGTLASYEPADLEAFGEALTQDAQYLENNNIPVVWWGLQNEPAVGPKGCIYSCCGYNAHQYYLAFNATAPKIRAALPHAVIHASSWSGQYWSPEISSDPSTLALVDAWTFHHVGANSNDQIQNRAYFLANTSGKIVMNNEFEYLDSYTDPERTINTAQSIMNWMALENAPAWYWLHALKPDVNSEAMGYGLGLWQPLVNGSNTSGLAPGHWDYVSDNFNAVAGFAKYMPWDSVRVTVTEDAVRGDQRVLAYLYDPAKARWLQPGHRQPRAAKGATRTTLDTNGAAERAAASKLAFVLTNRGNSTFDVTVALEGLSAVAARRNAANGAAAAPLPTFTGHLYGPNITDAPLGTVAAQLNATTGMPYISAAVGSLQIQFWVED